MNCLYLTPIFESSSNHKYDTIDYYRIDPAFGTNESFKELVKEIHSRGMKIILDGVFNHCGLTHPFFIDAVSKGTESRYWNWFWIENLPIRREPEPNYRCFAGYDKMPEWNLQNPEVIEYLLKIVRYWIEVADIDGWRLDTVEYLEPTFVKRIKAESKRVKPDAFVIGEVLNLGTSWFKGECLDSAMNYKLWNYLVSFFAEDKIDAETFAYKLYVLRSSYLKWANYAMYNMPDSHDRVRIMTLCNGNKGKVKLVLAFLFTYVGIPVLYYGDEIGMEGKDDPDCRRPMLWNSVKQDLDLFEFTKKLTRLHSESEALKIGTYRQLAANDRLVVYERDYGTEKVIVCLNNSENPVSFELETGEYKELIKENATIEANLIRLEQYGLFVCSPS